MAFVHELRRETDDRVPLRGLHRPDGLRALRVCRISTPSGSTLAGSGRRSRAEQFTAVAVAYGGIERDHPGGFAKMRRKEFRQHERDGLFIAG